MSKLSTISRWPACFATSPVVDPAFYPFGLTEEEAMLWFYRIKSVTFTAAMSYSDAEFSMSLSGDVNADVEEISTESDMTCPDNRTWNGFIRGAGWTFTPPPPGTPLSGQCGFDFQLSMLWFAPTFAWAYTSGGLIYPAISLSVTIAAFDDEGEPTWWNQIYASGPDTGGPSMVVNIPSLGDVTIYSSMPEDPLDSMTVTFNETTYWPYNPDDGGGDVYNPTTGAEERDPFSIQ